MSNELIKGIREAYAKEEGYASFASMASNVNIVPRDITIIAKRYAEAVNADIRESFTQQHNDKLKSERERFDSDYATLRSRADKMEALLIEAGNEITNLINGVVTDNCRRVLSAILDADTGPEPTLPQQGDRCPECGAPCKIIEKTYQEEIHDVHYVEHQYVPQQGAVTDDVHEKEVMMKAFDDVRKIFEGRAWIMEGRGSYTYNDDRYKEEVRYLYNEFDAIQKATWAKIKSKSIDYRHQIIADYLNENKQQGAVWVKASEYDTSKGGVLFYRFDGPYLKGIGIGNFVGDVFHGINLDVPKSDWEYLFILDECGEKETIRPTCTRPNGCIDWGGCEKNGCKGEGDNG